MDAFVTVVAAQPRQRARSPERAFTQLRIQDLRRVASTDKVGALMAELKRAEADASSTAALVAALEAIGKVFMSLETLEETNAGIVVKRLSGHADGRVKELASTLYATWRADAKAAALRRAKRKSQEDAPAEGGKRRKSGASEGADDAIRRDAARDYMVADDADFEAEVAAWDEAAVRAAGKPSGGRTANPGAVLASSSSSSVMRRPGSNDSSSGSWPALARTAAAGPRMSLSSLLIPAAATAAAGSAAGAVGLPAGGIPVSALAFGGAAARPAPTPQLKLHAAPHSGAKAREGRVGGGAALTLVSPPPATGGAATSAGKGPAAASAALPQLQLHAGDRGKRG